MGNLGSITTMVLTIILVPLVVGRIPYLRRPDVVGRRVAKAQLPGWVTLVELLIFAASEGALVIFFFIIESYAYRTLHHGRSMPGSIQPSLSVDLVFFLIEVSAPVIMALPLGMLLANVISWLIPPIRNAEYKIMAEGVPGYNWRDLNLGLIKASLIISTVCVILCAICMVRP